MTNIAQMQRAVYVRRPLLATDTRTEAQRHQEGFNAYCPGLSVADLSDPVEIEGWWSANRVQAYAETQQYV